MMKRTTFGLVLVGLVGLLTAAAAGAHTIGITTPLPACTDAGPKEIYILNATAEDDCDDTRGGTTTAWCCCREGVWDACSTGGGGGSNVSDLVNDVSCNDGEAIIWDNGSGLFHCGAVSGSGLTHPQVMSRASLGF